MKTLDVPCGNKDSMNASFIAGVNDRGYFIVKKNRIGSDKGYTSKYHVRKILKKLAKLGYGSSTWAIYEI